MWHGFASHFWSRWPIYALLHAQRELSDIPYLTITDTSCTIIQGDKHTVINFADVESFEVARIRNQEFVTVHYKPDVENQKIENASIPGRILREMNKGLVNAQEIIATTGASMETQELYILLNDRLRRLQNKN